ncbi:MAG TPA: flagellar biosynthesis protein FlhF, partial [Bacillales bacterium]|nr:flagellar biosynthesis protein FlhF [Bacillales bacterium]
MKVKKYKAPSMPEAMKLIRRDLGGDAIILNTREVESGGFLGFFARKHLEVVAAVDPDTISQHQQVPAPDLVKTINSNPAHKPNPDQEVIKNMKPPSESLTTLSSNTRSVEMEIRQINGSTYPGPLQKAYDSLQRQEIEAELIEDLMRPLLKEWYTHDETLDENEVFQVLRESIQKQLEAKETIPFGGDKKYLLLAGPTGVGKTTTLAKLAAKAKLEDHKEIAFITADTYRIAA